MRLRIRSGRRRLWLMGCAITEFLLAASVAPAQYRTVGTLLGRVADERGRPMAGIEVTLRSDAVSSTKTAATDDDGRYRITDIVPREYAISFVRGGVEVSPPVTVAVRAGGVQRINAATPARAEFADEIEVLERDFVVETMSAIVNRYLIREEIDGIPVRNRTFNDLLRIVPGFQVGTIAGTFRNVGPRDSFNVHGARANQNNYLLDGVSNNDRSDLNAEDVASVLAVAGPRSTAGAGLAGATFQVGAALQTFNLDAVEEVQIQTSLFSAEFGDGSGSVVNVITRTGSDEAHGSVTAQGQTEDLLEGEPQQDFTRAQLAGAIGGPIVRGATWYFATYERDDYDLGYDFGQSPYVVGPFLRGLGRTANRTIRDRLTAKLTHQIAMDSRLTFTANAIDERAEVLNSIFRATVDDLVPERHDNRSLGLVLRHFHVFPGAVELESIVGYTTVDRDFDSLVDGARALRLEVGEEGLVYVTTGTNSPDSRSDLTQP
jgi:hypothetical protein